MTEDTLKDHERRIIRLEECYKNMDEKLDSLKTDLAEKYGRIEKSIDHLREKIGNQSNDSSATKAQVSIILSLFSPIITGLIVYFLTRG